MSDGRHPWGEGAPTYPPCPSVTPEVIAYLQWRLICCSLHASWTGSPLNSGVGAASVELEKAQQERRKQGRVEFVPDITDDLGE